MLFRSHVPGHTGVHALVMLGHPRYRVDIRQPGGARRLELSIELPRLKYFLGPRMKSLFIDDGNLFKGKLFL